MPCDFSFKHYEETLERARNSYRFITMKEFDEFKNENWLFMLRHDVDFHIKRALEFAKIENKLGIKATYLIRVHAKEYNPFEFNSYRILRMIQNLGHEIGLHFEVMDMAYITNEDPDDIFKKEKKVLEAILDSKIVTAGEHADRGGVSKLDFFKNKKYEDFGIINEAYDEKFMGTMKYISDSNGRWREKCFCQYLFKEPRLYILTHPIFWWHEHYHTE